MVGFKFLKDSGYQGYATIRVENNNVEGFDIYNIYDTSLYDSLTPSSKVNFYADVKKYYIFDSYTFKLYELDNDKLKFYKDGFKEKIVEEWFAK